MLKIVSDFAIFLRNQHPKNTLQHTEAVVPDQGTSNQPVNGQLFDSES